MSGRGDPVPKHLRTDRRAYDPDGREITPATVGQTKAHGVTHLWATCACGHEAHVPIAQFPDETFVPDCGLRMRCSACGRRGVRVMPDWPPGPSAGPLPIPRR